MSIRIDSVGYTEKPMEYVLINKRLAESRAIDLPWQKICNLVGDKGYAFCVADFNGDIRNKESFKRQQIFALNFDKDNKPLNRKSNKNKVRNFNFIILENKCRLYREFATDERRLHHDELFGIACNLNNIECGNNKYIYKVIYCRNLRGE